jgi:hypothetical protein
MDEHATVSVDGHTGNGTNTAKGKSSRKGRGKPSDRPIGKRSLNLSLPMEDYERLAVHALRMDTTISELVCKLAREHLREFHITRNASKAD